MKAKIERDKRGCFGLLTNVPDALQFEGFEIGDKYKTRICFDLVLFTQAVAELKKEEYIEHYPLYLDFITAPLSTGIPPFQFDTLPTKTIDMMMDHQKEALNLIVQKYNGRCLIALPPGTGKTLSACVYAFHLRRNFLILCPATVIKNWQREFTNWTGMPPPSILQNAKVTDIPSQLITTLDKAKNCKAVIEKKWDLIIMDECHMIKGDSQRANNLMPTLHRCESLILLSGTPQDNKTTDLFNQLHALHPTVFSNKLNFVERFSKGFVNKWGIREEISPDNLDELHLTLSTCAYRRTDINVVDQPMKRYRINLEPNEEQSKILKELKDKQLELIRALPQAANEFESKKIDVQTNLMWETAGIFKAQLLRDEIPNLIRDHPGEKIAFFVYHKEVGEVIFEIVKELGESVMLTGETNLVMRDRLVEEFRKVNSGPVFGVMSIRAMGVGCNFVPGVSVIVFVEIDRSPAQMEQAEKRAHRKGAQRGVTSYWFFLNESNDESTFRGIQKKKQSNGCVLDGERDSFTFGKRVRLE